MRTFIINSLDVLVWCLAALIAIGGIAVGFMAMGQGRIEGLGIVIGGILYAIVFAGMFFIVIGIHDNTKRTAEAVERLAAK
ncbi:hypothetical protein [Xinfangfangia pollutisoli]|uniref:hypothetical protein n=1 Tax=Xinfangfangia pollutisoli TaxID=2865960 RepID=UPI001CD3147C|nr:hypothetical protein [Xinfangfangia pollutisoli]